MKNSIKSTIKKIPETSVAPTDSSVSVDSLSLQEVGARLRAKRTGLGLTLDQVAERSGFGKGYLSRIENGKKVPPIGTLARITAVLGIDVASILSPEDALNPWNGVSFVKATEKRPAMLGGSAFGYDYFALTNPSPGQVLQAFIFSFPSEVDKFVFFQHDGEELIHVISGEIAWQVGSNKYRMQAGDTIHFDARIPHRGHSLSGSATALVVMYSPSVHQSGLA